MRRFRHTSSIFIILSLRRRTLCQITTKNNKVRGNSNEFLQITLVCSQKIRLFHYRFNQQIVIAKKDY